MELEEIKAILKKYGQEHLLNHYENLDDAHKKELLKEIKNIDFELMHSLYQKTKKAEEKNQKDEITPIEFLDKYKLNDQYKYYEAIGKKEIKAGCIARPDFGTVLQNSMCGAAGGCLGNLGG